MSSPEGDAAETPREPMPAAGNKCKKTAKMFLDFSPMIIQMSVGFGLVQGNAVYVSTGVVIGFSLVALLVDYIHCKHRWEAGLEAIFPKAIPVAFFLAFVLILVLLCAGALTTEQVILWNGPIVIGGLFLASLVSQLIGKPWIRAVACEAMTPEQLQQTASGTGAAVFDSIMTALTTLWTCIFAVMTICQIAATIWKAYFAGGNVATTIGTIAVGLTIALGAIVIQPRVMKKAKQRTLERLIPGYDPESPGYDPFQATIQTARDPVPSEDQSAIM